MMHANRPLEPFVHYWSLAVEEQFYVFFPVLVAAVWRFWGLTAVFRTLTLLAGVSFLMALFGVRLSFEYSFFATQLRVWELLAGALVAYAQHTKLVPGLASERVMPFRPLVIWGSLIAFVCCFILLPLNPYHPGLATVPVVLGTCAVLAVSVPTGGAQALNPVLGNPVMRYVGLISFALYLVHQPILAFWRLSTWNGDFARNIANAAHCGFCFRRAFASPD